MFIFLSRIKQKDLAFVILSKGFKRMDISFENLYLNIGAQVDNSLISFICP